MSINFSYPSNNDIYVTIRSTTDNKVWNESAKVFETYNNANITDYAVFLTDQSGDYYTGNVPGDIEPQDININYYKQLGVSPATNDTLIGSETSFWTGNNLQPIIPNTLSPYALCTLEQLKLQLNITTNEFDDKLIQAINSSTSLAERMCNKVFVARDLHEFYDVDFNRYIKLRYQPVITVYEAKVGYQTTFSITYTGNGIDFRTGTYDDGMKLQSTDEDGVATNYTIPYDTYKSSKTIVDYINTLPDWSASLVINIPSKKLSPVGMYNQGTNNGSNTFQIAYPNSECLYRVDYRTGTLSFYPVNAYFQGSAINRSDRNWLGSGFQNVYIKYRAGYEILPYDINQMGIQLSAFVYQNMGVDPTLTSENIGDYSYTKGTGQNGISSYMYGVNNIIAQFRIPYV